MYVKLYHIFLSALSNDNTWYHSIQHKQVSSFSYSPSYAHSVGYVTRGHWVVSLDPVVSKGKTFLQNTECTEAQGLPCFCKLRKNNVFCFVFLDSDGDFPGAERRGNFLGIFPARSAGNPFGPFGQSKGNPIQNPARSAGENLGPVGQNTKEILYKIRREAPENFLGPFWPGRRLGRRRKSWQCSRDGCCPNKNPPPWKLNLLARNGKSGMLP